MIWPAKSIILCLSYCFSSKSQKMYIFWWFTEHNILITPFIKHATLQIVYSTSRTQCGVSFTKLCDASYNQLTHCRSHELILLSNCNIAFGMHCANSRAHCLALHRVTPRVATCVSVRKNQMYELEHLCERPPWSPFFKHTMLPNCISEKIWWCIVFSSP